MSTTPPPSGRQPAAAASQPAAPEAIREAVRSHYAAAITAVEQRRAEGSSVISADPCCGDAAPSCCGDAADGSCGTAEACGTPEPFGAAQYGPEYQEGVSPDVMQASFGCGNPLRVAELNAGERVLDLGSGGGLDVLLSARRVGPTGYAYGLDMTDEMLAAARRNAVAAGAENVEFLKGTIEQIPLPDASIDVVISNCVINLSGDKPAVFAEAFRVLRPGGRIGVSDIVCDDDVTPEQRAQHGSWAECAAGALSLGEYRDGLSAAGFVDVEVSYPHDFEHGMHSAVIRAVKPADQPEG